MGPETYLWLKAVHILGFVTWMGSLIGGITILRSHVEEKGGKEFHTLEKRVGIAMDVGAAVTIVVGLIILLLGPGAPGVYLKGAGYFHAKLAAVVLLIVMHVITRVKMKKLRAGDHTPLPVWVVVGTEILLVATVVLVVVKPF